MTQVLETVVRHAAELVVSSLWQGSLAVLVAAISLRVLPRIAPAQRFLVWAVVFLVALALPFAGLFRSAGSDTSVAAVHAGPAWGLVLAGLWVGAFAVSAGRLLLQGWRVRGIWLAARPIAVSDGISQLLAKGARKPGIFVSDDVAAPSVIGFFSPRLLVPTAMFAELSEAELRQIVLHECEHLRRYDDWLNLLQKTALAVFPLNLALVWVDRRMGLERELACDAGVVAATGAPLDYAACLARLAEHRMSGGRLALALSAWARRSELARRIYTLLQPGRVASRLGQRGALAAVSCVLLAGAGGMVRMPRLLSFGSASAATVAVEREAYALPEARVVPVMFHAPAAAPRPAQVRRVRHVMRPAGSPRLYNTVARPVSSRMTFVPVRISYSYAAVPFGDGWLIVQL